MNVLFLGSDSNHRSQELAAWLVDAAGERVAVRNGPVSPETVRALKAEFLISYNYLHIVRPGVLDLLGGKAINLHISYLPWNRGVHPNLWSVLEGTPKGVTIHLIDEGLDTGEILLQEQIAIDEDTQTLESSYDTLHRRIQKLFIGNWDSIKNLQITPRPQSPGGSIHYYRDFEPIRPLLERDGWKTPIRDLKLRYAQMCNGKTSHDVRTSP